MNGWAKRVTGLICIVAMGLAGCSDDSGNDSAVDAATDGPGNPGANAVELILENGGTSDVYVQLNWEGDFTPAWFGLQDQAVGLQLFSQCGMCDCDLLPDCQLPCTGAYMMASTRALAQGEAMTHSWDGNHWVTDNINGTDCSAYRAHSGGALTLQACWGDGTEAEPTMGGQLITNQQCETLSFTPGVDSEARIVIGP